MKHAASETPAVFIVSPPWPPFSWTVLQHSHALAGVTRPLTPPHLVSSVCTLSSSVSPPCPSLSPVSQVPSLNAHGSHPSFFQPGHGSWEATGGASGLSTLGAGAGGVSSSGEVEGPGPLCPAAIRNTGVVLLVWNSGPASSLVPSGAKTASCPLLSWGFSGRRNPPTSQLSLTDPGRPLGAPAGPSQV